MQRIYNTYVDIYVRLENSILNQATAYLYRCGIGEYVFNNFNGFYAHPIPDTMVSRMVVLKYLLYWLIFILYKIFNRNEQSVLRAFCRGSAKWYDSLYHDCMAGWSGRTRNLYAFQILMDVISATRNKNIFEITFFKRKGKTFVGITSFFLRRHVAVWNLEFFIIFDVNTPNEKLAFRCIKKIGGFVFGHFYIIGCIESYEMTNWEKELLRCDLLW